MSKCSSWTHMAKGLLLVQLYLSSLDHGIWRLVTQCALSLSPEQCYFLRCGAKVHHYFKYFGVFLTCHFHPVRIWTSHQPSGSSGRNLNSGQNSEQWNISFFHQWLLRLQFPTQVDHTNSLMPHDDLSNGPTSKYQSSIQSYERENSPRRPFMVEGWGRYMWNMWPLPW